MEEYVEKCKQLEKSSQRNGLFKISYVATAWIIFIFSILLAIVTFPFSNHHLWYQLIISCLFCAMCYFICSYAIPATMNLFIRAGLFGKDVNKPWKSEEKPKISEGSGLIMAVVYIVCEICLQLFFARENEEVMQ